MEKGAVCGGDCVSGQADRRGGEAVGRSVDG